MLDVLKAFTQLLDALLKGREMLRDFQVFGGRRGRRGACRGFDEHPPRRVGDQDASALEVVDGVLDGPERYPELLGEVTTRGQPRP